MGREDALGGSGERRCEVVEDVRKRMMDGQWDAKCGSWPRVDEEARALPLAEFGQGRKCQLPETQSQSGQPEQPDRG